MKEVEIASQKYPECRSLHEGYAIMLEEFDGLWDDIKLKEMNLTKIYIEAKHIACTSIRFMKMVEQLKKENNIIN